MSEQKDYISGLQISGKKYEINAKYLSGKELNDLMTIYIWDISNIFGKNIDVQNNTEISVGLYAGDISKYVFPVYQNYLDKKPIYVFNGDSDSPIILPAIVSIVDDTFNVYVYTTSKDTNYNQIYGTYSFSIRDLIDDGSMIVTASNYVHRFIEDGDIVTSYIWDISNIFGKNIDVQNNTEISVGLYGGDISKYVFPVYKNYLDKKPIYVFNGDNESPIILPAIVSIIKDTFNVYMYTTSKDTNYNQIYGTYSFSIKDLLDDGSMIVTASNYVHRFIEDGDISLKTINGQSLLGSGDITINGGSDNDNIIFINAHESTNEEIYNRLKNAAENHYPVFVYFEGTTYNSHLVSIDGDFVKIVLKNVVVESPVVNVPEVSGVKMNIVTIYYSSKVKNITRESESYKPHTIIDIEDIVGSPHDIQEGTISDYTIQRINDLIKTNNSIFKCFFNGKEIYSNTFWSPDTHTYIVFTGESLSSTRSKLTLDIDSEANKYTWTASTIPSVSVIDTGRDILSMRDGNEIYQNLSNGGILVIGNRIHDYNLYIKDGKRSIVVSDKYYPTQSGVFVTGGCTITADIEIDGWKIEKNTSSTSHAYSDWTKCYTLPISLINSENYVEYSGNFGDDSGHLYSELSQPMSVFILNIFNDENKTFILKRLYSKYIVNKNDTFDLIFEDESNKYIINIDWNGNYTINKTSFNNDNIYILNVSRENIEKSEVEHIYNHVSNGGIVFIKNDRNGYIIPSNIRYDNQDVYYLEFRCHDIYTEYNLRDELHKYIIYISTNDGDTYTIDKYISINKYFTECLLDQTTGDILTESEFNEILEAINKGKTPKYKTEKDGKIILLNVDSISDTEISLSSSITRFSTIHSISIRKVSNSNCYEFSYVEADN